MREIKHIKFDYAPSTWSDTFEGDGYNMLIEMLKALLNAKTPDEKEKYYCAFESLGINRETVNYILINMKLGGYNG